jgi:hypothetical protein
MAFAKRLGFVRALVIVDLHRQYYPHLPLQGRAVCPEPGRRDLPERDQLIIFDVLTRFLAKA